MAQPIAEVIESSTRHFVAEVFREAEPPAFGTWVRVEEGGRVLYGLVSHVEIGSLEPSRQATAFGLSPDELRRERPQVFELLRKTIRAQVLAYRDARGTLRQTLPPQPAPVHAFAHACTDEEVCGLGAPYDFLRTLAHHPDPAVPADDLLVAVLNGLYHANAAGPDGERVLIQAGRALTRLLNDDHERLHSILRRVG